MSPARFQRRAPRRLLRAGHRQRTLAERLGDGALEHGLPGPDAGPLLEDLHGKLHLEAAESGLAASAARARARGLGTEFEVTLGGQTGRFTLGAALVHVTTHGMHHRAQCLNMLRHQGVPGISDRLPEIDPLDWQLQAKA